MEQRPSNTAKTVGAFRMTLKHHFSSAATPINFGFTTKMSKCGVHGRHLRGALKFKLLVLAVSTAFDFRSCLLSRDHIMLLLLDLVYVFGTKWPVDEDGYIIPDGEILTFLTSYNAATRVTKQLQKIPKIDYVVDLVAAKGCIFVVCTADKTCRVYMPEADR